MYCQTLFKTYSVIILIDTVEDCVECSTPPFTVFKTFYHAAHVSFSRFFRILYCSGFCSTQSIYTFSSLVSLDAL